MSNKDFTMKGSSTVAVDQRRETALYTQQEF